MARPIVKTFTVADEALTGFASDVTGATWTLTTTATSDGLAHQVSVVNDSINDHSAKTAVLVGTDANNNAQTETINLPGISATVESTKYFKTLTSITPSATIGADTMDIGWVDEIASNTILLNAGFNCVAATVSVIVTGTINFTVQECFEHVLGGYSPNWVSTASIASKTASTTAQISIHASAVRVITSSYSSGAALQVTIRQDRPVG